MFLGQWILTYSEGLDPRVLSWQERGWGSRNYECLGGKSCDIPYDFLCHTLCVLLAQSCLTLCNPMDCSLPGSFVHGILQARILERVAFSFSKQQTILWSQSQCKDLICSSIPITGEGLADVTSNDGCWGDRVELVSRLCHAMLLLGLVPNYTKSVTTAP